MKKRKLFTELVKELRQELHLPGEEALNEFCKNIRVLRGELKNLLKCNRLSSCNWLSNVKSVPLSKRGCETVERLDEAIQGCDSLKRRDYYFD